MDTGKSISVGVLGLGQIGGSLCAALNARPDLYRVGAFDPNNGMCNAAIARSIVDRISNSEAQLIESSDIVIVATHVDTSLILLDKHRDLLAPKELVFDVGSVKIQVCRKANDLQLANFIGAHPIAGTERVPPDAWDARLFAGAQFLYCELDSLLTTSKELFKRILEAIDAQGAMISPEDNDFQFGLTIGLPHVFAYALHQMRREAEEAHGPFEALIGPSYRSATRVANSDPRMVEQMLWYNRRDLVQHLKRFEKLVSGLRNSLESEERRALYALINSSGTGKIQ